jgi:ATP phosphoribosyltransferase regulatory subunit
MALQPAAGARDLNPLEVDGNRWLCDQLADVYRQWGFTEVAPPLVERLETLNAGGGIHADELVRLAADDPLGLRPEMTASIARAACTRLAARPRPLRLWSCGPVFRSRSSDTGQKRLEEQLQSGVELLGADSSQALVADAELLRLLLACLRRLGIDDRHQPTLLLGHHGVLTALLDQVPAAQRTATRQALITHDPLSVAALDLPEAQRQGLLQLMRLRGEPNAVLTALEQQLGSSNDLVQLKGSIESIAGVSAEQGVRVQLDPSFQPHFNLYDGLVLKLVCQGRVAPLQVASGGRYDALVARFGGAAGGMGFGFDVEAIRELLGTQATVPEPPSTTLIGYAHAGLVRQALDALEQHHARGARAELLQQPCASEGDADAIARTRGCATCHWIGS